jgi:predicted secreted protein
MKKRLILVVVAAIFLVTGCTFLVKTYTDPEQTISVSLNQEFIVALNSNPTTGYTWQQNYDETMLKLVEKTYEQNKEANPPVVGAGVQKSEARRNRDNAGLHANLGSTKCRPQSFHR